jgi:hypothetical protein
MVPWFSFALQCLVFMVSIIRPCEPNWFTNRRCWVSWAFGQGSCRGRLVSSCIPDGLIPQELVARQPWPVGH